MVLPGSNNSSAVHLAERLRSVIAAEPVSLPEGGIRISMSLGVTATVPGSEATPEMLIRAADEALYRAKAMGRNRVEWNPLIEVPAAV